MTEYHEPNSEDLKMATANYMACAYNAAVNAGTERGIRKMDDLIEAINLHHRIEGREKLQALVDAGIIGSFEPCGADCMVYRGGLRHGADCQNDPNHTVYKSRQQRARELLPGGSDGNAGWRAAYVSLVGHPALDSMAYYQVKNLTGRAVMAPSTGETA